MSENELQCRYDFGNKTLFISVPPEIAEQCKRISLNHEGTTFTTLFTECGAAFGMEKCCKED